MRSATRYAARLALLAVLFAGPVAAAPSLVLVNGKLFDGQATNPAVTALAVEDGRISAVGSDADMRRLAGPATRVVDAGGRLVVPGLVEAHVHVGWRLPSAPLPMPGLPFPGPSAEQVLAAVGAAAASGDGWISAWIGPRIARDPRNWRAALDAVAPRRPVLLRAFWGHTTIVNSAALAALGIREDVTDPIGGWWGRDAQGRLDGRAYQAAEHLEVRAVPPAAAWLAEEFAAASRRYARWGVTSIHLMNSSGPLDVTIDALTRARPGPRWTVYAWAAPARGIEEPWREIERVAPAAPARVKIEGPKWVLDGTPIEQLALRREDYPGRPGWRGRSNFDDTRLREILRRALASPRQLALHVVGDAQTDRLLTLMRELAPPEVWRAKRVRLEHGDGVRPDTLAQVADFGLVVVQNPTHLPQPMPGRTAPPMLLATLTRGGVTLALGSDGGEAEQNPFFNMMLACTYIGWPGEALTRGEALRAYTLGGALAERAEGDSGALRTGQVASFAVLSQDVLTVPAADLPATHSVLTLADGVVIHEEKKWER
jgi:predicted amidohydrolase YtcJ